LSPRCLRKRRPAPPRGAVRDDAQAIHFVELESGLDVRLAPLKAGLDVRLSPDEPDIQWKHDPVFDRHPGGYPARARHAERATAKTS
jgi:hypothetical protein